VEDPRRAAALIRLILFDLDGTLVDSREDVANALNHALAACGLPPLSVARVAGMIGGGVVNLIQTALGDDNRSRFKKTLASFREHYSEHLLDHTVLYPGVRETLARLGSCAKAVLTNKPTDYSLKILEGLAIGGFFTEVMGGDRKQAKKPAPDAVHELLNRFSLRAEEALMVGDSTIDIETGRNAGIRTGAVTYGFGRRVDLEAARPDYLLDTIRQLAVIVETG
jgi:phosphoglycolate phosphatase